MKNPLYALLIADDSQMRLNLLTGVKKISIREGHRDYQKGPMMVCDHENPISVMVDITEVKHVTLSEVTQAEWEADGFVSQTDLLQQMRRFYPSINLESSVTIIFWENVRGYWATEEGIQAFLSLGF